jgi:hypothetical protein
MSGFEIVFWFWIGFAPGIIFDCDFMTKEFWIFIIPVIILSMFIGR